MSSQATPGAVLINLTTGHWTAQMLRVVSELSIADLLKDGPRSSADLAAAANANEDALYRVLRALASQGVFEESGHRVFSQTAMSALLRADIPGSLRAWAMMISAELTWRVWPALIHTVRTGESAVEKTFGPHVREVFAADPEFGKLFDESMTSFSTLEIPAIIAAYDFGGFRKIVDVAGGHGTLLAAVLQAYPAIKGVVTDLPSVVEGARRTLSAAGLDGRAQAVAADIFESVPDGADAYMLKHVIHGWNDDRSLQILRNCRKAMAPDGKVLIIDSVIQPGNAPDSGKLMDIHMLGMLGRERTEAEFGALLDRSGFRLNRIVPTPSPVSVVEGLPV